MRHQGIDFNALTLPGGAGRHDVQHICPECGGNMAAGTGLVVIAVCWACRGTGRLTNDEIAWYQAELYRRAER